MANLTDELGICVDRFKGQVVFLARGHRLRLRQRVAVEDHDGQFLALARSLVGDDGSVTFARFLLARRGRGYVVVSVVLVHVVL